MFFGVQIPNLIYIFRPALEDSDNPETIFFPDYRSCPVSAEKKRTSELDSAG